MFLHCFRDQRTFTFCHFNHCFITKRLYFDTLSICNRIWLQLFAVTRQNPNACYRRIVLPRMRENCHPSASSTFCIRSYCCSFVIKAIDGALIGLNFRVTVYCSYCKFGYILLFCFYLLLRQKCIV